MKLVPLSQGKFAMVDDADFEAVTQFKWHALKKGRAYYAARTDCSSGKSKMICLHNYLLGILWIDHRDGDGLNNQRSNLRRATQQQNNRAFKTKGVGASSQYRGVSWDTTRQAWAVGIKINGRRFSLGRFTDELVAARVYDTAAIKFFGEFAAPNFPA